jgi:hypothetical protein
MGLAIIDIVKKIHDPLKDKRTDFLICIGQREKKYHFFNSSNALIIM